ncbi:MAG: cytochrome P450 [Usitatibacter sp.]
MRYVRNPQAFYLDCVARYGDVFTAPSVLGPIVVLSHPDDLRALFSLSPHAFGRWSVEAVQPLLGRSSMILTDGAHHLAQRRMTAPAFHREAIGGIAARIDSIAADHLQRWPEQRAFDIKDRLLDLSIDVILQVAFGSVELERLAALGAAIRRTLESMSATMMLARVVAPRVESFGPYARFLAARAQLDRLVFAEIDAPAAADSMLGMLHGSRDAAGKGFTREELRDQLVSVIFAGHETSAIGLAWAMYWLHRHPASLEFLRAELVGAADISRLPYLDAVCREALRLHPTVPEVVRKLKAPLVLRNVTLPAGTAVAACIAATHHRESLYPEPGAFRPERFLERRFGPDEFLPFGGGVHRCAGEALAMLEMKTILARVVTYARFELLNSQAIRPRLCSITMEPRGKIMLAMTKGSAQ